MSVAIDQSRLDQMRKRLLIDRFWRHSPTRPDPTRWAIFERTLRGPRPVRDIAGQLPVSRVAVSQHLKVLKEAGLVTCQRDGSRRLYSAEPRAIGALASMMSTIWREVLETRTQDAAEGDQ